jgi:hypothetical protein
MKSIKPYGCLTNLELKEMKPPDYESEASKNQTIRTGLTKRYAAAEVSPNYLI